MGTEGEGQNGNMVSLGFGVSYHSYWMVSCAGKQCDFLFIGGEHGRVGKEMVANNLCVVMTFTYIFWLLKRS